ncbi:MAG TPA: hypothetical protein VEJ88_07875, partial [Dissulfurispiraceae bacterium]|nr:hypothetical protein [Dissulfurispiraceae bacterium]
MAEKKEKFDPATSTERLLDVIRGKSDVTEIQQTPRPGRPEAVKTSKAMPSKITPISNAVTVGLDIGDKNINLVKAARSGHKWNILEYKSIPIPADLEKGSDGFNNFLKSAVAPFCSGAKKLETWAIMPSEDIEVRLIRIPKVPAKHLEATVFWTLKKEVAIDDKDSFLDFEVRGQTLD